MKPATTIRETSHTTSRRSALGAGTGTVGGAGAAAGAAPVRSGSGRRLITRRSAIHGNGVFAAADIDAGTRLIEYRGRLLTHAQSDCRYGGSADSGHTFLFVLNDRYVIDANQGGNSARWINHSCDPNCEAVHVEDPGGDPRRDRIVIESIRPIVRGEELTYNYGIVLDVPHTASMKRIWACRCGSDRCTGTILQPKPRRRANNGT